MSTNFNTCFIDSNGADVSQEFIEKSYLLDVYPNLINPAKAPSLWVWGYNANGELGTDSIVCFSSPVQTISAGNNWKQVVPGVAATAAIKTDGTLWLWGCGNTGCLGTNNLTSQSSPVQTISGGTNWKQVSVGNGMTGAIKTDGTLWVWGLSSNGQLGTNSIVSRSSPVQTVSGGTNWKQVSLGGSHTTAIKTDGTLWVWGSNGCGQLGNYNNNSSSPVQTVSGGTNWKQVSAGFQTTAAIKTDGTLWVWGGGGPNGTCGLGDGTSLDRSSPVQTVSGGTNWKCVSVDRTFAALKTDGTLWLWGWNCVGQVGDNTILNRSSPVQTVSGGTNWKQVSTGSNHTIATKTDGSLWIWGEGSFGRLGTNSGTDRSSPVQTVSGGTNWKEVKSGNRNTAAIREEGDW